MNNERSTSWALILYPNEDLDHKKALDYIINNYSKYAYINHDSDLLDTGELKKEHTHVIISFTNYRWRNAIAQELNITPNYLEKVRNLENSLKYLIHFNNSDKYQYEVEKVQGTLKQKLISYINTTDKSESDKVLELLDYLESQKGYVKLSSFIKYVCSNNLYDIYRRSATTFVKLLDEHNFTYTLKTKMK